MKLLGAEEEYLAERERHVMGDLREGAAGRIAAEEEIQDELLAGLISIFPSHRFKTRQYSTQYPPVEEPKPASQSINTRQSPEASTGGY